MHHGSGATASTTVIAVQLHGAVTGSTQTDYIYDGSMMVEQIVRHFDANGAALDTPTTVTYLQGPSGPLYRKSSAVADPSWYVYDGLGSVVGEVDVNGNMTASKEFDVYGLTRNVTGTPTTRQGFVGGCGHESDDETGLIYMRARYYDPGTGRFISQDPQFNGENWFIYAGNNPVCLSDYNGKSIVDWDLVWKCYNAVIGGQSAFIVGIGYINAAIVRNMLLDMADGLLSEGGEALKQGLQLIASGERVKGDSAGNPTVRAMAGTAIERGGVMAAEGAVAMEEGEQLRILAFSTGMEPLV